MPELLEGSVSYICSELQVPELIVESNYKSDALKLMNSDYV
jgi:hypothetical protein